MEKLWQRFLYESHYILHLSWEQKFDCTLAAIGSVWEGGKYIFLALGIFFVVRYFARRYDARRYDARR